MKEYDEKRVTAMLSDPKTVRQGFSMIVNQYRRDTEVQRKK